MEMSEKAADKEENNARTSGEAPLPSMPLQLPVPDGQITEEPRHNAPQLANVGGEEATLDTLRTSRDEESDTEDDEDTDAAEDREEDEEGDDEEEDVLELSADDTAAEAKFLERVAAMDSQSFNDLESLEFLTKARRDSEGRRLIRVVGKYFPAKAIDVNRLKDYVHYFLAEHARDDEYCIVYIHTDANSTDNSPGLLWLRSLYLSLPRGFRKRLRAVYILHPALRMRLSLWAATQFLGDALAHKLMYVSRIEFLWDYMKQSRIVLPDFVKEHDKELESRPLMDYGIEVDESVKAYVNMPM